MRFKAGDKVIVKSFSRRPMHWNSKGNMDKWMGKVVTIRSSLGIEVDYYLIKEDGEKNLGFGWGWAENDLLPIPKPGDRVKIRTWEDMEKQYGLDRDRDINTPLYSVVRSMKKYCGTIVTVKKIGSECFVITNDVHRYSWGFETIEQVYPKEEKMKFTKDMLKSGEHVVEYRNGTKRLYLNGYFVGPLSGIVIESFNDNLKYDGDAEYDIVAIYEACGSRAFDGILTDSRDLIWKRDNEPIEISATEAFAQLREIYGKEVKIVEDKDD